MNTENRGVARGKTPQPITPRPPRSSRRLLWPVAAVVFLLGLVAARSYINRVSTERETKRLLETNQGPQAVALLQEQIQSSPSDAHLYLLLGRAFLKSSDLIQAQEAFNQAVTLDASEPAEVARSYFEQGESSGSDASADETRQLFAMAAKFDPSLAPKIGERFYSKAKAAFQLPDVISAEQFFGLATQYDSSLKRKVAADFAAAADSALDRSNPLGAEHYAKESVSYDPESAQKHGQALFDKLAKGLCNLHALGRQRFMTTMLLCSEFGIPDATAKTIPYRFAYGMHLYESGQWVQGIDILRGIAHDSPASCEGQEAHYVLSPPPPGRIVITGVQPVTALNNLTIQLLYVDVSANGLRLTFSMRADGSPQRLYWFEPNSHLTYILDDSGTRLGETADGILGRRQRRGHEFDLAPGEQFEQYVDFPLPTAGSNSFRYTSPLFTWPVTHVKRDLLD